MNKQLQFIPRLSRGLKQFTLLFVVLFLAFKASAQTPYYSAATGALNTAATWWSNPDGATGFHPAAVSGQTNTPFHVANGNPGALSSSVSLGAGSRFIYDNAGTGASSTTATLSGSTLTGTIDVAAGITLTISNSTSNLIIGTVSPTSTIILTNGSSETLPAGTYGNLTIGATSGGTAGTKTLAGNITVAGNLTLNITTSSGFGLSSFALNVQGNIVSGSGTAADNIINASAGTVNFNGSTAQTVGTTVFTGSNGSTIKNLTINNSAGVTFSSSVTVSNALTLTSGSLALGTNTLTIPSTCTVTSAGGNIDASTATLSLAGTLSIPTGVIKSNSVANLTLTSGAVTIADATTVSTALTLTAGSLTVTGGLTVSGGATVTRAAGSLPGVPIYGTAVNVTSSGTTTSGNELTPSAGSIGVLTISAGTYTLGTSPTVVSLSVASGATIDAGTNTITPTTSVSITGTFKHANTVGFANGTTTAINNTNSPTITLATGSTVNYAAANAPIDGRTYSKLTFSGTGTATLSGNTTLSSTLAIPTTSSIVSLNSNTLTFSGTGSTMTLGTSAAVDASTGTLAFTSGAQTVPANAFTGTINNLTINNTSLTFANGVTLGGTLTLTAGTLTVTSGVFTVNAGGTVSRAAGTFNANPTYGAGVNVTITATANSGKEITPASGSIATLSVSSGTYTLNASSVAPAALSLANGTILQVAINTLILSATPAVTGTGAITANGGTIALNGTLTIPAGLFTSNNIKNLTLTSGTTTWNNASTNLTGAITLTAGTLLLGANTLNISGTATEAAGAIDASAGTINLNAVFPQSMPANMFTGNINNLTITNATGVTLGSATTVANALTLTSGALTVTGGLTVSGGATVTMGGGSLAAAPAYGTGVNVTTTVTGTSGNELTPSAGSIGVLAISSGTYTLASAPTASSLTVASGATIDAATNSITLSSTGANISGTFKHANTNGFRGAANSAIANTNSPAITLNSGSTVIYYGAGTPPVSSGTYSNLTVTSTSGATLSGATTVTGTLSLSGPLTVGGNTLTINDFSGSSTNGLNVTSGSTVTTTGALSNPLYFVSSNNTLGTLNIGGNATLGNAINMAAGSSAGTVNVTSGTLTTGGNLSLLSDANGTARIAAITGTVTGNVNIQRFVPGQRGYRLLGHPYTSNVDLSQLYATFDITGLTGNAGSTCTGTNPSTFSYTAGAGGYTAITGTGAAAFPAVQSSGSIANGILAFVRGSKGQDCNTSITTPPSDITFTTASGINQGDVTETVPANGWNLIANPYPSQVLLSSVDNINNLNAIIVVEPGGQNLGNTYTNGTAYFTGTSSYILPINGAILANNTTGSPISLVFHETSKNSGTPTTGIMKTTNLYPTIELSVYYGNTFWDAWHMSMKPGATGNAGETGDLEKIANTQFSISSLSTNAKQLAWDARDESDITDGTVVPMNISSAPRTTYTLQVTDYSLPGDKTVYLHDKYTNSYVLLSNGTSYPFTVNSDTGSQGQNRMELVFNVNTNNTGVSNVNNTQSSVQIVPNPASSNISLNYSKAFAGGKTISIINAMGQVMRTWNSNDTYVNVFVGDLPSGIYLVKTATGTNISTERFIKN